jgi:hypothetical protein
MNKKLTTLLLIFYTVLAVDAQNNRYVEFPSDTGAWWYTEYNEFGIDQCEQTILFVDSSGIMLRQTPFLLGGPTLFPTKYWQIGKLIYGKLDNVNDPNNLYQEGDTLLLFDFSISVGDTFIGYSANIDQLISLIVTVDDSIGYFGRRKLVFNDGTEWVEGIGTINSAWSSFSSIRELTLSGGYEFKCTYSDSASFPCSNGYFVKSDEHNLTKFKIWPIPFRNDLNLEIEPIGQHNLRIFNNQGSLVFEQNVDEPELVQKLSGLNKLPHGAYWIEVTTLSGTTIQKSFIMK